MISGDKTVTQPTAAPSIFDQDLPRNEANFAPLSPLGFIERTAEVYPDRLAIVHGSLRQTWGQTYDRCRRLASALQRAGVGKNDTVAVMLPNTPPMVEAHFGVPMAGAVLNALNTRLDPETIAFMLDHGEAKVVIVDPEFSGTVARALALRQSTRPLLQIDVQDELFTGGHGPVGSTTYEAFLAGGDPAFAWQAFCDEPLDALLPIDHPLAENAQVRLEELADTPFLMYQRSFVLNDRLMQACQQLGFTPKEIGRSGQADFLAALVAAGQGVVLLPSVVARGLVRPGVVRLALNAPDYLRWDIAFIWRQGAYLSKAAQAWLALLRERPVSRAER